MSRPATGGMTRSMPQNRPAMPANRPNSGGTTRPSHGGKQR